MSAASAARERLGPTTLGLGASGRSALLSQKERLVLREVACGGSTETIAETLHLSPHTVRTHLRNIMGKLDARSRAHAVAIAMHEQAIHPTA